MPTQTRPQTSTTEMQVTSIRLERALKDRLKQLSGSQGYQALVRDILWNYVQYQSGDYKPEFNKTDIRATLPAIAQKQESCVLTGKLIAPQDSMLFGLTSQGSLVPLSIDSL